MPRPPRGYEAEEYPLPHSFSYNTFLQMEDETKNSIIYPILRATEAFATPETIEVNPSNATFAEETGASIHMGSIVPRINISWTVAMSKLSIETDKLRAINFQWFPIYTAFLDSLTAEDIKTATEVEDILQLTHNTDNKDVHPTFVNVNTGGTMPMNTVAATEVFGDWGLDTSTVMEFNAYDSGEMFDALRFFSNKGMLAKVVGKIKSETIYRDKPFRFHSNNFTHPTVKRGNPYTFCGIMLHLPQSSGPRQYATAADTTVIDHLDSKMSISFDEWNPNFNQSAF